MADNTGITVAILKGSNAPKPQFIAPDMSQDHLEALEGDFGAAGVVVEHNDGGVREQVRSLPKNLETSPLTTPRHPAKPYSSSQKPRSPGRVGTGRRGR